MLIFLKGTRELKLTLIIGDMSVVKWWVGASFAVHKYFRGHTGSIISLGKVSVSIFSTHKKINRMSSIEGELIGVDNAMSKILWSRYFIEAQGYKIAYNRIMQDNKSAILLGGGGKFSTSKRTKHINTR